MKVGKGIQVLDLFSGCGGLSYGFHKKNEFQILGAIDFDEHANTTYKTNFGITPSLVDIGRVTGSELSEKYSVDKDKTLIFIGGPPCQGFSSHRKKDKRKDERNSLVVRYVELGVECNADVIVIENVPDLFSKKHWKHYQEARNTLEENGYSISSAIVNMAEYGVPQERFRAVVIASKVGDIDIPKGTHTRGNCVTVRKAISTLPALQAGEVCKSDPMHITSSHRKSTIDIFKNVPFDGGMRPKGIGPKCLDRVNGFSDVYGRLFWDKPSVTITARCRTPSCGRFTHPEQHRGLTVREAGLLQGFPKKFYFEGPFDDKYKQIGNAVPPRFSTVLARHILKKIEGKPASGFNMNINKPIGNSFSTLISFIKKGRKIDDLIS